MTSNSDTVLAQLVSQVVDLDAEIGRLDAALARCRETRRRIVQTDLPELMSQMDLSEFKSSDGTQVRLRVGYNGYIAADRAEEACRWLSEHGYQAVVRRIVTVEATDAEAVDKIVRAAERLKGVDATKVSMGVHPQTMKRVVRELYEGGAEFPAPLLGASRMTEAQIKLGNATPAKGDVNG